MPRPARATPTSTRTAIASTAASTASVWDKAPAGVYKIARQMPAPINWSPRLADHNQFWRLTAQRLLVDGKKLDAVDRSEVIDRAAWLGAAIHALWSSTASAPSTPRPTAPPCSRPTRCCAATPSAPCHSTRIGVTLIFQSGVVNDPDLTTRLAAFVALAQFPSSEPVKNAIASLGNHAENREDPWLSAALDAAAPEPRSQKFGQCQIHRERDEPARRCRVATRHLQWPRRRPLEAHG